MKKFNKKALLIAMALGISSTSLAVSNSYQMRIFTTDKLSTWAEASDVIGDWTNNSGHYACNAWTPPPETVNFGNGYLQSRVCQQNQDSIITHREMDDFQKNCV